MKLAVVVSCEHGGRLVPDEYREAFDGAEEALESHRGWDPGALELGGDLAVGLGGPLLGLETSRLLVDTNRSLGTRTLFSEWSRKLPEAARKRIVETVWRPHRAAVERAVEAAVARGENVLHVATHSFTPFWNGLLREVDVGFLYDPRRRYERAFAELWRDALRELRKDLVLRRNQPYRGDADGLTTYLRTRFEPRAYLGIELEVSQRFPLGPEPEWRTLRADLVRALQVAVRRWTGDGA